MRDRTYKPQTLIKKDKVSQTEIDKIREDATHAKELLANPYLQTYFNEAKQKIVQVHAKQSLQDSEESTEHNGIKRTLKFPAVKEYTLLAGQYRFIDQLTADLEQAVLIAKVMEEKLKDESLEVTEDD